MEKELINIQIGALLHDIGKIVRRAGKGEKQRHSKAGSKYLKENKILETGYEEVHEIIKYHHSKELKEAKLPYNSLAYIVYEADNIASGIDRVKYDETVDKMYGNEMLPLNSLFNRVKSNIKNNMEEKDKYFSLMRFKADTFNMPKEKERNVKLDQSEYLKILNRIRDNLLDMKDSISPEKLTTLFEESCVYFPSSSYVDYPDISYYDHVKLTAAVASCLYLYDKDKNIKNFKEEYFKNNKEVRNKEKFLFVSGEFSGIQDFIYTITSKMAMKSLRGRSFYLELFIEHIVDEILLALDLSRVNLIYSGGSQFYLLLPNIEKTKDILNRYKEKVNDFLLKETGIGIYFEMSYNLTTADELGNGLNEKNRNENKIGEIFRKNSILISKSKLNRYSENQMVKLFDENSEINEIHSYTKECKICKKSEKEEILIKNSKDEGSLDIEICNSCKNYIKLGKNISKLYHENKDIFIVEESSSEESSDLIFPTYPDGYVSIKFEKREKVEKRLKEKDVTLYRFYAVNSYYYGEGMPKNIRIGNYNINSLKNRNSLVEFKELVKMSKGIERMAVLRADVDNLGTLFQSGFIDRTSEEPYKFVTLSKSVVLSRYLSDFFKRKINLILEKQNSVSVNNEFFKKHCDVINQNNEEARNIVIVYSGGDDIFAVGTWNDIIEFSVDLRTAFKEFTNGKITLSAGIGFFSESFPIYQMALKTGELEKIAKSYCKKDSANPTKDAVALFGEISKELNHVYNWDKFIDKVLYEKYSYLKSKITFEENGNSERIFVGKSKWYKIMDLIENQLNPKNKDKRLDIARFAYILARIKSNDKNKENYQNFKEQLFKWIKNPEDAKELLTAINLIIYEEREN